jgi:class 3 adenylate cyclase/tetratricopeptide (TPR) repeat protein
MDIDVWLRGLGLEQYASAFLDNAIDAEVLRDLTADDLKDLGVNLVGHRRKLLAAIAALKTESSPAPNDGIVGPAPVSSSTSSRSPADAERRQLTVMFCDLVGSTALSGKLDPEDMREVLGVYHAGVSAEVGRFDGFVAKFMGDGVLAYFGYPHAHEDDAERAIRTALAIIERIGALNPASGTLAVRVGIATGLVVVGDLIGSGESQERGVVGETPNLAARLQAMAEPNGVLIAGATRQLVGDLFEYRDLGSIQIRGFDDPVLVSQVLRPSRVESRFEALHATALTPLVGREEETDLLLRRWHRAKSGEGQIVLISGEPGIGKSRLMAALQERLEDEPHIHLRYFCSPYHRDSAFHPFIVQIERAAGFDREDNPEKKLGKLEGLLSQSGEQAGEAVALLADLLSVPTEGRYPPGPADPQRRRELTLAALLSQLEIFSQQRPVLMMFEDAHWADSTSLEVLDRAVERARQLPMMIVITFRPEFTAPWVGQAHVTSMGLSRLAQRETAVLVDRVTGGKALPAEILDQIVERTDGIPLFVEELTKTLLEGSLLREGETSYTLTGPLPPLAIPSSLQASLLARLDRLMPVKEVAQIGAALGREFSYELLAAVARHSEAELREALDQLTESGLVFRRGNPPHATFMFKHALVQDAAYSTLLRGQRQKLHARIGKVLEEQFPEINETQPEIVAHHYTEGGVIDRAIEYWHKAGQRDYRRSAVFEAIRHLTRGITLIPLQPAGRERDRRELSLSLLLGRATWASGGRRSEALQLLSRAYDLLDANATLDDEMAVNLGLWQVQVHRGELVICRELSRQALSLVDRNQTAEMFGTVHHRLGVTLLWMGIFGEASTHLTHAREYFASMRNNALVTLTPRANVLSMHGVTLWALGYPDRAVAMLAEGLADARSTEHALSIGIALFWAASLETIFGGSPPSNVLQIDEATAFCGEHLKVFEPWGRFNQGLVVARHGDPKEGIEGMQAAMAEAREFDMHLSRPIHLAHLATAYASIGEADFGIGLLNEAIQTVEQTQERLFEAEIHRLHGDLLNGLGKTDDAQAALARALTVARSQDARLWELRAATSLARLWRDQGKHAEACDLLTPVYDWFTEGFDTADLKEAKALLDELT